MLLDIALNGRMSPIRILLANHQPIVRSGLRLLLERDGDLRVVAEAANGREAMVLTDFTHPEVALLEVPLPLLNGIAVAREISRKDSRSKVIFVTAYTDEEYVIEAFKAAPEDMLRVTSHQPTWHERFAQSPEAVPF